MRKTVPVLAALLLTAGLAQADLIDGASIAPSTSLPFFTFNSIPLPINQINDGITGGSLFNGFAADGITSGRITLTLDQTYDLDGFILWNDIFVLNEGVRTFTLEFLDTDGSSLGSTGVLSAVSQAAAQTYSFASAVQNVKTVYLDVLTSSLQIEIRELAFTGGVSAVPEPSTVVTLLAGLSALFALSRARRA